MCCGGSVTQVKSFVFLIYLNLVYITQSSSKWQCILISWHVTGYIAS